MFPVFNFPNRISLDLVKLNIKVCQSGKWNNEKKKEGEDMMGRRNEISARRNEKKGRKKKWKSEKWNNTTESKYITKREKSQPVTGCQFYS